VPFLFVEVHDRKIFHTYTVRNNRLQLKDPKAQVEFVAVKITIYISAQRDERQAEFITQYVHVFIRKINTEANVIYSKSYYTYKYGNGNRI
jgi:hypothetical protein